MGVDVSGRIDGLGKLSPHLYLLVLLEYGKRANSVMLIEIILTAVGVCCWRFAFTQSRILGRGKRTVLFIYGRLTGYLAFIYVSTDVYR